MNSGKVAGKGILCFDLNGFHLKNWRQPGANEKTTYKMNCKWLIIKWAQLGSGPTVNKRSGGPF
jgi:hypothetical protein